MFTTLLGVFKFFGGMSGVTAPVTDESARTSSIGHILTARTDGALEFKTTIGRVALNKTTGYIK